MSGVQYKIVENQNKAVAYSPSNLHLTLVAINPLDRNLHWSLEANAALGAGTFVIARTPFEKSNTKVVWDVNQGQATEGNNVISYNQKSSGTENQRWEFKPDGSVHTYLSSAFVIQGKADEVVLTAAGASPVPAAQIFKLVDAPLEYTITVQNKLSTTVVVKFTNAPASETGYPLNVNANSTQALHLLQGSTLEFRDAAGNLLKSITVTKDETVVLEPAPPAQPLPQYLLYSPSGSSVRVEAFNENGQFAWHKDTNWPNNYTLLSTGDFRGVKQSDVVAYIGAGVGKGIIGKINPDGTIATLSSFDWWDTWKYMLSGDFTGRGAADIFLHEDPAGTARQKAQPGGIATIVTYSNAGVWNHTANNANFGFFDRFVKGKFLGTAADQLVSYNTSTGQGKLTGFNSAGGIALTINLPAWTQKATHIVAGNFRGNGKDCLLEYDRTTGTSRLLSFDASGNVDASVVGGGWRTTWDILVAGDFRGLGRDDLILYSFGDAGADIVGYDNNGHQNINTSSPGWHSPWNLITVSDRYTAKAGGQSQLRIYDNAGYSGYVIWNKSGQGIQQFDVPTSPLNATYLLAL